MTAAEEAIKALEDSNRLLQAARDREILLVGVLKLVITELSNILVAHPDLVNDQVVEKLNKANKVMATLLGPE